jgi:hypothetical protein
VVVSPTDLASILARETPEELLIASKQDEIKAAINRGETYTLTDDLGRMFLIEPKLNGQ